jgi:negative regulator of sigma E activity
MNNDELPTNVELASAYLDGELDAAERATAANDAGTMALVDLFARIRAELGEIPPVVDSTRTAAMAAALSEFDAIRAAATMPEVAAVSANVTSLPRERRVRAYQLVTGLAAAAVIVVIGVAALASRGDDPGASPTAVQAPATTAAPAAQLPSPKSLETAETAAAAGGSQVLAASAADSAIPAIGTGEELTAYAASIDAERNTESPGAPQAGSLDASALPDCLPPTDTVLGAISFQGTPALAVRDADGELQAVDATDCRVLFPVSP